MKHIKHLLKQLEGFEPVNGEQPFFDDVDIREIYNQAISKGLSMKRGVGKEIAEAVQMFKDRKYNELIIMPITKDNVKSIKRHLSRILAA